MSNREGVGWTTLEMLRTKMAVRDVARMVSRDAPKDELLAKYPDLRDQDIELATRIASAPLTSTLYYDVDEIRFRRHPDHGPRVQISEFATTRLGILIVGNLHISSYNRSVRVRLDLADASHPAPILVATSLW